MKGLILSCLAIGFAMAQGKTASNTLVTLPSTSTFVSYPPGDVRILGDLDYGQSRESWDHFGSPRYRAFVFSGYGGDKVDIVLKSDDPKSFMAVADSTLKLIGSGSSHMILSLPYRGPDIEVYYIVFPAPATKNSRVAVRVNRISSRTGIVASEIKTGRAESYRRKGL